jgi:hypothetical protein
MAGRPALMSYRVAAGVLAHLLPVEAGKNHDSLRSRTLKINERPRDAAAVKPAAAASAITLTVGSTFIRSLGDGERHLEVCVGNVWSSALSQGESASDSVTISR